MQAACSDEDNDTNLDVYTFTIRQTVLSALGKACAGSPLAVDTCVGLLQQPADERTRSAALHGLGLARHHAAVHAPLVRRYLNDPVPQVRTMAEEALANIGAPRDGPVLKTSYDDLSLPESERARLWDIEHRGNVLNSVGFTRLSLAVKNQDTKAIQAMLAPEFQFTFAKMPTVLERSGALVVRREDHSDPRQPTTAETFVQQVLQWRQVFGSAVPNVKVVMATLRPADDNALSADWLGTAILRLHGDTATGGPAEIVANLTFRIVEPTDPHFTNPGWLKSIQLDRVSITQAAKPLFAEAAAAHGLTTAALHDNWTADTLKTMTGGAYVTDFNRDGYLDVLISDVNVVALYAGGAGGKFTDVTAAVGLKADGIPGVCGWFDINGDGWDELILDGIVYENKAGGQFVARDPLPVPRDTAALVVADYDRDGKLDVYAARSGAPGNLSWLEGRSNDPRGNTLLRNLGDWKFADVTKKAGVRGGYRSSFTAAWLDADDDGWPDLLVPNEFGDAVLLRNNGDGTFAAVRRTDTPADYGTMGLAVGDFNNDGRIDLYSANMYSKAGTRIINNLKPDAYPPEIMQKLKRLVAGSQLHLNKGGLEFEQTGVAKQLANVGWAYGPALADYDGDGHLDIFATAGYLSRDRSKPDG
jgi:hypothetical protein